MQDKRIPYGYCQCGCGEKTKLARITSRRDGHVKGEPFRFLHGHNGRIPDSPPQPCECGCGQLTRIAVYTDGEGAVKGQPMRFLRGHNRSSKPVSVEPYVVDDAGCWIWQRSMDRKGYGQIRVEGRLIYSHRYMYERHVGPIHEGLELDHLCRVPACCNPQHLEPVTHAENVRRGWVARRG